MRLIFEVILVFGGAIAIIFGVGIDRYKHLKKDNPAGIELSPLGLSLALSGVISMSIGFYLRVF
jgi:hypothetical protein